MSCFLQLNQVSQSAAPQAPLCNICICQAPWLNPLPPSLPPSLPPRSSAICRNRTTDLCETEKGEKNGATQGEGVCVRESETKDPGNGARAHECKCKYSDRCIIICMMIFRMVSTHTRRRGTITTITNKEANSTLSCYINMTTIYRY